MGTHPRTLVLASLAALTGGLVLTPGGASAGPPLETYRESVDAVCEGTWSGGTVEVGFSVRSTTDDARIDLFDGGGEHVAGGFVENAVQREGLALSASVPLVTQVGEDRVEVGSGAVTVSLAVDGEPQTYRTVYQRGNVRFTDTQVVSPLSGSGTLQLLYDGVPETVALECSGALAEWTERRTSPDAGTVRVEVGNLWCRGWTQDGQPVEMFLEVGEHDVVELYVGAPVTTSGYTMELTETREGLTSVVPLWDESGQQVGSAQLELAIDELAGERNHFVLRHGTGAQFFVIESLRAAGSIELFGDDVPLSCSGERTLVHEVLTTPSGPGASGPVPVNDAPIDPTELRLGERRNVHTRAAAVEAEIPYWCYEEPAEAPDELRPGHTLWYAFTGTGAEITVDTAGSDFNTVLAVYRVDPSSGGLTEVACVDDVPETLQAQATVPTEAGVRYLVQVGGHAHQSGRLRIALG